MATRGRKPKPTAMKELEGNPGKHPLNTSEPKPNKKAPACPKWLEPEAKKEWRRLAKQMEAIGILTEVDMAAFAGYCQAYARWKEAEEVITQRHHCQDPVRLLAAGAAGVHRTDLSEDYEQVRRAVRPDPVLPKSHHCFGRRSCGCYR